MPGFVDQAQIHVKGGDGGAGAVSFRREAHVDRGGPDGGDGGSGGHVWLEAQEGLSSLLGFRDHPHRRAANGTHGQGRTRQGRRGDDLVVGVPVGTVVRSLEGEVVADLARAGERWLAAVGGQGGRGNARFVSNRRRAPSFAEQGEVGEERWFDLELKLVADVALVGLPNAGKSTLISRVSAAKPRIADYPFTTLEPHLGVVRTEDGDFVMADVPGLIEGASAGRGLGHRFLRHVERARVLVLLVDLAAGAGEVGTGVVGTGVVGAGRVGAGEVGAGQVGAGGTPADGGTGGPADGGSGAGGAGPLTPAAQEAILLNELARYQPDLLQRPRVVVGSKADVAGPPGAGEPELRISAVTGAGVDRFLHAVGELVAGARQEGREVASAAAVVVHRPRPAGVEIVRDPAGGWLVRGRSAERAVALNDLTDAGALEHAQRRLRRLGVDRALARAGAREGDLVRVGEVAFTWEPDQ